MNPAKIKERELIVKLSKQKKSCREIAEILGVSKSKVSFWTKRVKDTNSLLDKPKSGRPTPLNNKELDEITLSLRSKLTKSKNKKAGFITKDVLALMEAKTKRKYTMRHAERIMKKIGLSLITPRVSHIRKDENAQDTFREEFKKNFKRNTWVFQ